MKNISIDIDFKLFGLEIRSWNKIICICNLSFSWISEGREQDSGIHINWRIVGFTYAINSDKAISIFFEVPIKIYKAKYL